MPNSIINSDDGVVSGQSGLKTSGGDDGVLNLQSNGSTVAGITSTTFVVYDGSGNTVFDTTPSQVAAKQTFYAIDDGIPIVARSTNSNTYKIGMQDTSGGTQRGYIGASSANALMVANGSATNVLNVTSAGVLQANSGYGSVANGYLCRAWVQFLTTTIYGSANVSSITYLGTGQFRINFSTAMPDDNYAFSGITTVNGGIASCAPGTNAVVNTGNLQVDTRQSSTGTYLDGGVQYVAVFR